MNVKTHWAAFITAVTLIWSGVGNAQDQQTDGVFSDLWDKTDFNGVVRMDMTWRTSKFQNPYNQTNMPFQDVDVPRQAYLPPDLGGGRWGQTPLTVLPGIPLASDTVRRSDRVSAAHFEA